MAFSCARRAGCMRLRAPAISSTAAAAEASVSARLCGRAAMQCLQASCVNAGVDDSSLRRRTAIDGQKLRGCQDVATHEEHHAGHCIHQLHSNIPSAHSASAQQGTARTQRLAACKDLGLTTLATEACMSHDVMACSMCALPTSWQYSRAYRVGDLAQDREPACARSAES